MLMMATQKVQNSSVFGFHVLVQKDLRRGLLETGQPRRLFFDGHLWTALQTSQRLFQLHPSLLTGLDMTKKRDGTGYQQGFIYISIYIYTFTYLKYIYIYYVDRIYLKFDHCLDSDLKKLYK